MKELAINWVTDFVLYAIIAGVLVLIQPLEPFEYTLSYLEFYSLAWGVRLTTIKYKHKKID